MEQLVKPDHILGLLGVVGMVVSMVGMADGTGWIALPFLWFCSFLVGRWVGLIVLNRMPPDA